jgi:hypothetical protein
MRIRNYPLVFLLLLAACEGPAGPAGLSGKDGIDAPKAVDITQYLSAALAEKTGGGADPWTVRVGNIDLNNDAAVAKLFRSIAGGIEGDDLIALDLSGCTGWGICYNPGILPADKARIVSITFPESLTEITDGTSGAAAFTGFSALKTISAPGLTYVGNYAFNGCTALETISLPKVTSIGDYAFAAASATPNAALTTLDLTNVRSIGNRAFGYCTSLTTLRLGPTVPSLPDQSTTAANGIFLQTGNSGSITIQVPGEKQSEYDNAGWKDAGYGINNISGGIKFGTSHKAITISTY